MDLDHDSFGQQPWRAAAGLLAFCLATLIGVIAQHAPETVLIRSVVATAVVYVVATILHAVWTSLSDKADQ